MKPEIKYAVYVVIIEDTNENIEYLAGSSSTVAMIRQELTYEQALMEIHDIERWAAE